MSRPRKDVTDTTVRPKTKRLPSLICGGCPSGCLIRPRAVLSSLLTCPFATEAVKVPALPFPLDLAGFAAMIETILHCKAISSAHIKFKTGKDIIMAMMGTELNKLIDEYSAATTDAVKQALIIRLFNLCAGSISRLEAIIMKTSKREDLPPDIAINVE